MFRYSVEKFEEIFDQIIDLKISPAEIKQFLLDLNKYNLPQNAFTGAVLSLKKRMKKVKAPKNTIDVCGTGGDGLNTLNISTAVCFILAASDVTVAKHGNRAISSLSGSADIFSELGIKISDDISEIEKNFAEKKLCFLFAPFFHESLKNISIIRKEIATATIFNFLGPLLNPANTSLQLIGCSKKDVMYKMLKTFDPNNTEQKIHIVHGFDGMDEISLNSNSYLLRLENGKIFDEEIIDPKKYGFTPKNSEELKGQDPKYNATKLLALLDGEKSAYRDIVLLNSAFALKLSGKINNIEDGIDIAKSNLDNGLAKSILLKLQSSN